MWGIRDWTWLGNRDIMGWVWVKASAWDPRPVAMKKKKTWLRIPGLDDALVSSGSLSLLETRLRSFWSGL